MFGEVTRDLEIRDYPGYRIIKIDQSTKKSVGDLRRLTISQTPVKASANAGVKNSKMIKYLWIVTWK